MSKCKLWTHTDNWKTINEINKLRIYVFLLTYSCQLTINDIVFSIENSFTLCNIPLFALLLRVVWEDWHYSYLFSKYKIATSSLLAQWSIAIVFNPYKKLKHKIPGCSRCYVLDYFLLGCVDFCGVATSSQNKASYLCAKLCYLVLMVPLLLLLLLFLCHLFERKIVKENIELLNYNAS